MPVWKALLFFLTVVYNVSVPIFYLMPEIVFDIETYGDIKNYDTMKVTVVSIFDYASNSFYSFDEHELANLWPYFERADRIIGYNSISFDVPILNKYYAGDLTTIPHLDLLKEIKDSSGSRYKLDDIASATLQMKKSADGLQALRWYEEGKIDEIKKYCEQDVKVTRDLYEFGLKNKMLYYPTLTGQINPIAVDFEIKQVAAGTTSGSVGGGINMTLPF